MNDKTMLNVIRCAIAGSVMALAIPAAAQEAEPRFGPIFEEFGPHYPIDGIESVPMDAEFAVAFDVAQQAAEGTRNRGFESAARFINMHASLGVDPENIRIAVVVHGSAVKDLLASQDEASRYMVEQLLDYGVRFIVCGQSAAAQGIAQDEMIPGVEMALSAMTAHALLQQRGYTVNPF